MSPKPLTRTKSPSHPHLKIGPTAYGLGVFSRRYIRKGEQVGIITGDVMDEAEFDSNYCMDLGHSRVLEPRNIFRRMNHSCNPNCELIAFDDPKDHRILVEAIRDIRPGEELAIDYAWPSEFAIRCLCGDRQCRGWIVHPDEVDNISVK